MKGLSGARKRNVASAIDQLTRECESIVGGATFVELPLRQLCPYHNHCFKLYKGERLNEMVESIKQHGILVPIIALRLDATHFEILAGHNRCHAAGLADLKVIPAIIKEGLSDEEALTYVIETNLMQRSFSELLPSEQGAVLKLQHDEVSAQGKRNDILRELHLIETGEDLSSAPMEQRYDSRDEIGKAYGLKHATVARLIRLTYLIDEFKTMVDDKELAVRVGDDISFLSQQAQRWLFEAIQERKFKLTMNNVGMFKERKDNLSREEIHRLIESCSVSQKTNQPVRNVGVSRTAYERYFKGKSKEEICSITEQALAAWFKVTEPTS